MDSATSIQRTYYRTTACKYDEMHGHDAAHILALSFLSAIADRLKIASVLDVGAGTGRVWGAFREDRQSVKVMGIEPVAELRELGYAKGISRTELIDGDAHALPFSDNSFDVVCAFGVMHHLADPRKAVFEMLRVARRAVFISDHNDYGRGSIMTRALKQFAKGVGLWNVYKLIVTRGRGYRITDDDGLWYPYSIFDTYESIQPYCSQLHFLNTASAGPNLYRSASHVALLGIMSDQEGQKRF